jgi:Na+/H+ antiporter NhaA
VLAAVGGCVATVLVRRHVPLIAWLVVAVALWACFYRAGIDAPLSAVVVGMCVPASQRVNSAGIFRSLTASVNIVVLPLFALVATGVVWTSVSRAPQGVAVAIGLAISRIAGKVVGIGAGAIIVSRLTHVPRPPLALLLPIGLICAMGVTVPLIFAHQVYGDSPTYAVTTATLLGVTVLSGAAGVALLRRRHR